MINADNAATFIGATVVDNEGEKIGTLGQIYADATTGVPTWGSVKTGMFGKDLFVPLSNAEPIDGIEGSDVRVAYSKHFVKDAPKTTVDGALTKDQELALFEHYAADEKTGETIPDAVDDGSSGPRHRGTPADTES